MSRWRDAVIEERIRKATKMYESLKDCPIVGLSKRDQALAEAFGWFCLESDECPDTDMEISK